MIGQRVSNYRILEKIGSGASGSVYRAAHATLGIDIALKFIHPDNMVDPENRARFAHEARAAATLDHTAICKVFDYEEFERSAFIAMDFIEGESLRDLIARGPLPLHEALLIAIQIAEGLEQAHDRGIIHRDIKPSNVMIRRRKDGRIQAKILDFGVARTIDTTRLTTTGTIMGTSTYMSPEQVRGREVDHRSDLWSLGAVLYEMLTGIPPFPGDHPLAVQFAITHNPHESARRLRGEIPPDLNDFVNRCLKKDPSHRIPAAGDMLVELRSFLNAGNGNHSPLRQWLWKYRNRLLIGGSGLLALALLGVIVPPLIQRPPPPPNPFEQGRTRQLFHSEACESQPRLSPDGTRVVFTSNGNGNRDIMWVGLAGGDPVPLTDHPADDRDPCWMPDGNGILFYSERGEGVGIWKTDLTGTAPRLVIKEGRQPAVSPDGTRVAFSNGMIQVADLGNPENVVQVSAADQGHWSHSYPAWSPDGTHLAYGSYHNLWEVSLADGSARPLTDHGVADDRPVYSRDGRFVYFTSFRDGRGSLWRVDRGSGDLVKMTPGSGPEIHPDLDLAGGRMVYSTEYRNDDVSIIDLATRTVSSLAGPDLDYMGNIAPGGRFMVFVSKRWIRGGELWLQDLEDGRPVGVPRRLLEQPGTASHPVVSPDGKWVAYYLIDQESKGRDLWIAPIPSGPPTRITDHPDGELAPAWSPEGNRIAFISDRDSYQALYVIPVADGRGAGPARRISPDGFHAQHPTWSPDGTRIAFQATTGEVTDTMVMDADGSGPPRLLTEGAGSYLARWIPGLDELWVSGKWGGYRFEIRRLDPAGGTPRPFDPPLFLGPECTWPYFFADENGRHLVHTETRFTGDIWVLEALEGVRF